MSFYHFRRCVIIGVYCLFWLLLFPAVAADSNASAPAVVDQGFQAWAKKGNASYAMDVWKKGGLLEDERKPSLLANYFSRLDRTVGNFKSYEVINAKQIGESSQIVYAAINFERVAVYARFLLYRTDKGWVVQNMDFSTKPVAGVFRDELFRRELRDGVSREEREVGEGEEGDDEIEKAWDEKRMGRAFSPSIFFGLSWGVAPGWYGARRWRWGRVA